MSVLVVVPVYNEAPTVGDVVARARVHAPVLVVDDGSSDPSGAIARSGGAEVIRHTRRLGKGQALRTAAVAARARGARVMLTLDGDGQHDPEEIPRLLAAARESPRAIVIGSRLANGDALPRARLNAMRVAGFFASWASGLRAGDTQSGFRAYPLALFDDVRPSTGGFVFETEILLDAAECGWPIIEVPVSVRPRATERSRFRPALDGLAIATCLARRVGRRWRSEARDAALEVAGIARGERRRVRHAATLAAARPFADSFPSWSLAVGLQTTQHVADGLAAWWRHPRLRRAGVVATATAVVPVLLVAALLEALASRWAPDLVTPIVSACFSQERLDRLAQPVADVAPARAGGPQ